MRLDLQTKETGELTRAANSKALVVSYREPTFVPIMWRFLLTSMRGSAPAIAVPVGAVLDQC